MNIKAWSEHLGLREDEKLFSIGGKLYASVLEISPDRAKKWLVYNTENRPNSKPSVSKIKADIKDGNWFVTHQGIGFYEDGVLADAQTRLQAIVDSEKTIKMVVVLGISKAAKLAIDDSRKRTDVDVATLAGVMTDLSKKQKTRLQQVAKSMMFYPKHQWETTKTRRLEYYEKHREHIRLVDSWFANPPEKTLAQVTIVAVLVRASYTQDHAVLEKFSKMFVHGAIDGQVDDVPNDFRTYVLGLHNRSMGSERLMLNLVTTDALLCYIKGKKWIKPPKNLKGIKKYKERMKRKGNVFPLPSVENAIAETELVC